MPRATKKTETETFQLETLPEGFVELRQMSWGERLRRQEMAMEMGVDADRSLNISAMQVEVTFFEFKISIVDHNLEDENGRNLAFSQKQDFMNLDPIVATEIQMLIDKLNGQEVSDDQGFPDTGSDNGGSSSTGSNSSTSDEDVRSK